MEKMFFYPRVAEIVWENIENDENNIHSVRKKFIGSNKIFQFAYCKTYPEAYSFVERWGIDLRIEFHLKFREWNGKNNQRKFEERQQLPPTGAIQKKLVTEKDHEEVKKLADEQREKELKEKKSNKKRRLIAVKNK